MGGGSAGQGGDVEVAGDGVVALGVEGGAARAGAAGAGEGDDWDGGGGGAAAGVNGAPRVAVDDGSLAAAVGADDVRRAAVEVAVLRGRGADRDAAQRRTE